MALAFDPNRTLFRGKIYITTFSFSRLLLRSLLCLLHVLDFHSLSLFGTSVVLLSFSRNQ